MGRCADAGACQDRGNQVLAGYTGDGNYGGSAAAASVVPTR
jgi:hypothetical protein